MKIKLIICSILISLILVNISSATTYSYNQKIPILTQGEEIGYVEPYYKSTMFGNYAYLKWQRYGFPVGDSFPIALIEGTATALPFGIQGEFLSVKIGKITNSNVNLVIDQSSISQEVEKITDEIDKNINENIEEATENVNKEIEKVTEQNKPIINNIQNELEKLNLQLESRTQKAIDRNYYSSLHIIDESNENLKLISNQIKEKEAELAEKIGDKIIYILMESFVSPGSGVTYTTFVNQIPSEIRHQITAFLYNIDSKSDSFDENSLSSNGVATLYIGNPEENKVSAQFNEQLKTLKLPYFENNKIIGKETYSSSDVGIIASIPEERYWDEITLQNRWDNDKIRLYKTLIAGINDDGLETAAIWYNKQLDLAKNFISSSIPLVNEDVELDDVFNVIKNTIISNPEASISFGTIAQGWVLTAVSSLQSPDFERIDSLGYVVIVEKDGNSYKTLETYSIQGDKINSFTGDYGEIIKEGKKVIDKTNEITGQVISEGVEEKNEDKEAEDNFVVNFVKKIWRVIWG